MADNRPGGESGETGDWLPDDPFADPTDPAAVERERRRAEREERRRSREGGGGEEAQDTPRRRWGRRSASERAAAAAAPLAESGEAPAPPSQQGSPASPPAGASDASEDRLEAAPPPAPRTADEEFWDETPTAGEESFEDPFEGLPQPPGAADASRGGAGGSRGSGALGALRRHPFRVVAAIAGVVVVWFLWALFQPFHGDGSGRVVVTIPKGAGVGEVGDLLESRGVVDSSTLFQIRATLAGERSDLYAGRFVLAHGMSYGAALDALTVPPVKKTTTVTIPEGYSREQAAPLVREDGLSGGYMKETVRSKYLNPARYGGKGAKSLEGFLFPDTFELKPGAPAADLVQLQLQDFKRRIKGVDMSYARSKNLTVYDVLTIASMVEREAGVPSQRRLVAAVIYNRLREGIPLGIDATTRFAVHNYTRPLTESELATPSPYNTRTHQGLPPGPINSPGLAAIEAAAHPAKVAYLYYVVKPGACGVLSFSKTNAEFEADVERYNSARAAAGGNSPTTCGQ